MGMILLNLLQIFFFNRFHEKLKMYFITGGMPEVVNAWIENRSVESGLDFVKHGEEKDWPKIVRVWNSLPAQLSKENKKFSYKTVKEGARAREYESFIMAR